MGGLDIAALVMISVLIVAVTAALVALGSLPGKISRRRGHPYVDAVTAASWIGLATGVFWPLAFIWAFLPVPGRRAAATSDATELAELRRRLEALEEATAKPGSREAAGGAP